VCQKEAARVVHQQLVQLGLNRCVLAAESAPGLGEDPAQRLRPALAADPHPRRVDLPDPAHRRVDHGLFATPVGCALGGSNQGRNLRLRERKRQQTDAIHLDHWHRQGQGPVHAEAAWPLNAREQ
jgi:hypothetical protein